ncbi:zinc finger protein 583-like isoform X2 [Bufo bufo]|nr:zinc finger protein 583-like isoform X2 [Bufo bufo]XP_040284366.1 zinc finger protein 583-like isoform X2 [Bufo bufo]
MTSVSFKEVAMYFFEEEWSQLDSWQKELYSNVMRDIHTTLLSLGYTILHPDVLCRIRRNDEPYVSSQEEVRKGDSVPSSDMVFKIKCEEELCADEGNPTESSTKAVPGASFLSPDLIFRIKRDEDVCTDEENCKGGEEDKSELEIETHQTRQHFPSLQQSNFGYTILHPDVLCRIRRNDEPYISSQEEDRKGASVPSSDMVFKIKCEEELCADEGNPTLSSTKAVPGASVLSPDLIFRIKRDEDVCTDEENCKGGEEDKSELGFPSAMSDVLINKEGKSDGEQKTDQKHNHSHEDLTFEANHLVFNPKISIWPKQENEVPEVTSELLSAGCIDRNVMEIKTEIDLTLGCKLPPPRHLTETTSDTASEICQISEKYPGLHKEEHAGKGEESLLSIVLRRANAGNLQLPNYKHSSSYKNMDYSRGIPRIVEKETCYPPKQSFFQTPGSSDLLNSFHDPPASLQHCAPQIDKPFRCHLCDKRFKTLGILNIHLKTHSRVRPYQCSDCGKSFRDNWNLKVHQKIHTGETPYRCAICDKGFIQYATYMKHQRIHTGERPYSCGYCNKSFTNSSNLVRHYRTHTGEKPYICMECGKSFSYNTSLIQHRRSHKVEPAENATNGPSNK